MPGEKKRVLLAQVNNLYGERNCFLPYSIGCIAAYAQAQPDIADAYEFLPFVFLREDPQAIIQRMPTPDIVGFSNYIWNEQWNLTMAKATRQAWPHCLIVFGGPQVPERRNADYILHHPFLDVIVSGEGELVFSAILRERLKETPCYRFLPGTAMRGDMDELGLDWSPVAGGGPPERVGDLSILPSPYLSGVFDDMPWGRYSFHVSQETHRGCPWSCRFCDWGSLVYAKVGQFPDEKILAEYRWGAERKIELWYNCDANFAMLPRDAALVEELIKTKETFGYPKQIRAAWTKNANRKVFDLASKLKAAGMSKGITLSLQSTDPHTLDVIARRNIAMDDFEEWVRRYHEAGIGTYTELILGLPGETYDTFADGIDRVLRAGQHHGLYVYLCMALPNSEMSDPAYVAEHGIKTVCGPLLQQHATPDPTATEMADIVIATNTMPLADWKRAFMFAWAIQTFHVLGLTTEIAKAALEQTGLSYRTFYEKLLEYSFTHPYNIIGREATRIADLCDAAIAGGPWGTVIHRFGPVVWPAEEASFLRLVDRLDGFYWHLIPFLAHHLRFVGPFHKQIQSVVRPDDPPFNGDRERYARDTLWYGRKLGKRVQEVTE